MRFSKKTLSKKVLSESVFETAEISSILVIILVYLQKLEYLILLRI